MEHMYTNRNGNNFNLIRMASAYMVIFAHSTAIQGNGMDLVVRCTGRTHSGQMAVFIFTFLSGIFITKSIKDSDTSTFIKKRIFRLYPELVLCLLLTLILGSVFTTYDWASYWRDSQTWKYFFKNVLEVSNEHILPGVFENHPMQGMNGVLWFITFEIRIYFLWTLLKSLKVFDTEKITNIILIILLVWEISRPDTFPLLGSDSSLYGTVDFPQYTITFILAALFYTNVTKLDIHWGHLALMVLIMYIFRHSSITVGIWASGFILFAMYIGTRKCVCTWRIIDLSYGIFLYGWPAGQVINEFFPFISAGFAAIMTAVLSTACAWVSYNIVLKISHAFNQIKGNK